MFLRKFLTIENLICIENPPFWIPYVLMDQCHQQWCFIPMVATPKMLSTNPLRIMVLLTTLLVVHCMLPVRIGMLGIGVGIIRSIGIGIISVMRRSCSVIVMLLMRIGMVRRMGCRCGGVRRLVRVSLAVVLGYDWRGGLGRDPLRGILLHFLVKPLLVLLCHLLVLRLLARGEGSPALAKDNAHVDELDAGVFLHDLGTHVEGEEYEGAAGAFGLLGVLVLFHVFFVKAAILDKVTCGVVAGGRDVGGHFGLIACLVLGGVGLPSVLLLKGEAFVHVGGVFG
mmetsp:Transcript_42088/g.88398  ORF Transcript_42088/g.88398 Transcript_42088/m.88398 type:complete len:283 (+) Transcript_42088:70-918(+)